MSQENEEKGQGNKNVWKNKRKDRISVRAAGGRGVRSKLIFKNTLTMAGY